MDPASLTVGIAALYTTCRDCYDFFTTVRKAEIDSSVHLRELQIQQSILKAWGFHWQIHDEINGDTGQLDRKTPDRTKLQAYLLNNRFKAEGVFNTLSAIADTLSNQEKLTKRYGIQLRPAKGSTDVSLLTNNVILAIHNTKIKDVKPVVSEVKQRLSMLHKFKWAMKDKDCFQQLITDLKSHSESLYRLCPENAFESMNIYLIMECLARQESPVALKSTSRLAIEQAAENGTSSMRAGYQLLASAATLKASVNENRDGGQTKGNGLATVDEVPRVMRYLGRGLALFEGQVVYVEMRDYRGEPQKSTPEQRKRTTRRQDPERVFIADVESSEFYVRSRNQIDDDDETIEIVRPADPHLHALIVNFFRTFKGANMRDSVFGLDIAGMIDHTEGEYKGHCSILYRLPGTIGVQSRERPPENLKLRAPSTLQSLLGYSERGIRSMLGARFELARKLVRAVCLLHSSGWLHKNIRAESVIFFPEHVNTLQEDRYDLDIEFDVSKPILMGYIFSRPDDTVQKLSPSAKRTDSFTDDTSGEEREDPAKKWPKAERTENGAYGNAEHGAAAYAHSSRRRPRHSSIYGHNALEAIGRHQEAKQTNISGFKLDYYQHPAKHADPQRLYRHAYDVYSLGILLLEIGLWKELRIHEDSFDDDIEDHYVRRRIICREYLHALRCTCGDTYADVVLSCLMVDCIDGEASMASERELCAKIVADLEGCRA